MSKKKSFILWFNRLTIKDVPLVGGKNASLGEMYSTLTKKALTSQMVLLLLPMPTDISWIKLRLKIK